MAVMTSALVRAFSVIFMAFPNAEEATRQTSIDHLLQPRAAVGHPDIVCESWRVGVEANNVRDWKTVPSECESYVGHYMLGNLYHADSQVVVDEAIKYVTKLIIPDDGKTPVWVFDIDQTAISNLPYYSQHGFGAKPYNRTSFHEWSNKGEAPALPETLRLYNKLLTLGIKVVFLSGRGQAQRRITASNLIKAGYHTWEILFLRGPNDGGSTEEYKSLKRTELVAREYKIVGNIGDQWSHILGANKGDRTFKLPNPIYYVV